VKKTVYLVIMVILVVNNALAQNSGPGVGSEGLDQLTKEKGLFKTTLVNPETDFSRYNQLCPKRVLLQFRDPGPAQAGSTAGSLVKKKRRGPEIPENEDIETFRQIVTDAVVSQLGDCEVIELVSDVGPGTLFVRATVTDIVTDIVSKSEKGGDNPKPFTVQGEIYFDLIDAETGAVLTRVGERRKSRKADDAVPPPGAGAEWVVIWSWAEQAAADFRREVERVLSED
jgi:hypothetical protein